MRKVLTRFIIVCLILTLSGLAAFAATKQTGFTKDYSKDGYFYHNDRFDNSIVVQGIDISTWQNTISVSTFKKMKAAGVDFVIIRVGYSNITSEAKNRNRNLDDCFEANYKNAKAAGMEVGTYYYSVATSVTEAQKEANFVLEHIKGKDLTYPIFIDAENSIPADKTSKATLGKICNAFCQVIEEADPNYHAGVYSGLNYFNTQIGTINPDYDIWVAQYNYRCQYEGPYIMWQYASTGKVSGFEKNLDCNFRYFDDSVNSGAGSLSNATVKLSNDTYFYDGEQKKPTVKVTLSGKTLTEGVDYRLAYYKNVKSGTAYAIVSGMGSYQDCKIASFKIAGKDLSKYQIKPISSVKYTGSAIKPTVTVVNKSTGETLSKTNNYTVSYKDNVNVGKATVTVKGQGNYAGTLTATFDIVKGSQTISCSSSISKNGKSTFNLNATTSGDGKLTYSSSNPEIVSVSADGTVQTLGVGEATITVNASSTANCSSASKKVTVTVLGQVRSLTATSVKSTTAKLTWTKMAFAQKYNVYKYDSSNKAFKFYKSTTDNFLDLTGLKANTTYKFRLRLVDGNGVQGARSESISFKTPIPAVTTLKVKTLGKTTVTLAWTKVSSGKGYKVYKYNSKTKKSSLVATIKSNKTLSYKITKLKAGTKYTYKVRAYSGSTNGYTKSITFTTKK